jgi:hypothetical protein
MPAVELGIGLMRGQITLTLIAIIDSGSDATIGRDILNQFVVTLNGLASTVEISQ